MLSLAQRLNRPEVQIEEAIYQYAREHRGCMPGIIQDISTSPNVLGSTVTVRPAIVEVCIDINGVAQPTQITDLPMVKLAVLSAGGFSITFPVSVGDECLLIFQDMCLDAAWQSSGTNNPQLDKRRHDLSDAICLPLRWTQPSLLSGYSSNSMQIRSNDGNTVIDITDGQVKITAGTEVKIVAPTISMGANSSTPQTLMTHAFMTYWTTLVYPFLTGLGFTGGAAPSNSMTTNTEGA